MRLKFSKWAGIVLVCFMLVGCSSAKDVNHNVSAHDSTVYDPLETVNRAIFTFNGFADKIIIRPLAEGYRSLLPEEVRDSIQNVLRNLKTPVNLANQLLQADFGGAGETTARFLVNSTLGVAGIFDVADKIGIEYEAEDFGQTLAVWGAPDGPYVVVPLLGPSNLRDVVGLGADIASDPVHLNVNSTHNDWIEYTKTGLTVVDNRARLIDPLDDLKANSLDYYAAIRSVYKQFRDAQIHDQSSGGNMTQSTKTATVDMPDFDEWDDE